MFGGRRPWVCRVTHLAGLALSSIVRLQWRRLAAWGQGGSGRDIEHDPAWPAFLAMPLPREMAPTACGPARLEPTVDTCDRSTHRAVFISISAYTIQLGNSGLRIGVSFSFGGQ